MAKLVARMDVDGLDRKFSRVAKELQRDLRETMGGVAEDAELVFQSYALKDTGRMSRGVSTQERGGAVFIRVDAVDPDTGFDYVAVTRFGHRKERIYPTRANALATPWGPRASVRGFKPRGDWAAKAQKKVAPLGRRAMNKLGLKIVTKLR